MSAGRLRIFLGMCPGVGKTYAMLLAGQQQQEDGVKVAIGCVETHGRIETTALTAGLRRIPPRRIEHRGVPLEEMDLDAILSEKPALALVDELAHTNAPGSRHPKRHQDVIEILEAGIDVYTTLNVQHLESLRDAVAGITGIVVRETLPDSILDHADEIELVDVTPEQLRTRLADGKVYLGDHAARAADAFFREGNLRALREMALRVVADRADRQVRSFLKENAIQGPWRSRERLLVAVGGSPHAQRLIRITKRIADALDATWVAAHVETGRPETDEEKARTAANLSMARSLGAETHSVSGTDLTEALLECARRENVTQIVAGKTDGPGWWRRTFGNGIADRLVHLSGSIDILLVHPGDSSADFAAPPRVFPWQQWLAAAGVLLVVSVLSALLEPLIGYRSVTMLYILGVAAAGLFMARLPVIALALASGLSWNFLFTQPQGTLTMWHSEDIFLLLTFLIVAIVVGHQTARLLRREAASKESENRARALYELTKVLAESPEFEAALDHALGQIERTFDSEVTVFLGKADLMEIRGAAVSEKERSVCQWAFTKGIAAGRFTTTLPESSILAIPLRSNARSFGVLALRPTNENLANPLRRDLLEAFAAHLVVLIERNEAARGTREARVQAESHQLQRALLDDVSHELKTPVAVIGAAIERLRSNDSESQRMALLDDVKIAARRLDRVTTQLVTLSRMQAGLIQPQPEIVDAGDFLHEVVADFGTERPRIRAECGEFTFSTDANLLHAALSNLLQNAVQYSPPGSEITLNGAVSADEVNFAVADRGPGIPTDQRERLFERFQRGADLSSEGMGLGLSIARQFVLALGGTIRCEEREGGGSIFRIQLPAKPDL